MPAKRATIAGPGDARSVTLSPASVPEIVVLGPQGLLELRERAQPV
jgi:hypothetical protein